MDCINCNYDIPDKTDDYYNDSHTELECPKCNYIHKLRHQDRENGQVDAIVRQTLQTKSRLLSDIPNPILSGFEEPCSWCSFFGKIQITWRVIWDFLKRKSCVFIVMSKKLNGNLKDIQLAQNVKLKLRWKGKVK